MRVAGIDIGFRNMGISVFDVQTNGLDEPLMVYLSSECFKSKKVKKSKDYVSEQDANDIRFVLTKTIDYLKSENVDLVILELPTGGAKSSRAARSLGFSTCMCVAIPMLLNCKYMLVTPREVKLATTGDPYAEKNAIMKAMGKRFPEILGIKVGKREHIADSIGCILARLKEL